MRNEIRFELVLWADHLLKSVPGQIGVCLRTLLFPYSRGPELRVWEIVHIDQSSRLRIGENTSINRGAIIYCTGRITMGRNVSINPNVVIYSQNHVFSDKSRLIADQGYVLKETLIDDDVWIAAGAIILPGVVIGRGAVIGAGSVVTHSVPPCAIFAGVPAKRIGVRGY